MSAKILQMLRTGLTLLAATTALAIAATPVLAQSSLAADKAVVDAAKTRGEVGEQSDGYLGVIHGGDPAAAAAVAAINAGRAAAFRQAAQQTGTSPEAAGAAAARQLIARLPPGQYYRTPEGAWVRK